MSARRIIYWLTAYWFIAGVLLSLGVITIGSIGVPLAWLGVSMFLGMLLARRTEGFWAALVSFGAIPATALTWHVANGLVDQYTGILAICYWGLTLWGVVWGFFWYRRSRQRMA